MTRSSTGSLRPSSTQPKRQRRSRWVGILTILILLALGFTLSQIIQKQLQPCGMLDRLLERSPCVAQMNMPELYIHSLGISPQGDRMAVNGYTSQLDEGGETQYEGQVRIIGLPDGETQHTFPLLGNSGSMIAISPDGSLVASEDIGSLNVWEMETGELLLELDSYGYGIIAFSPDGTQIATFLTAWNLDDGTEADTEYEQTELFFSAGIPPIFSPAGGAGLQYDLGSDGYDRIYLTQFDDSDYRNLDSVDANDPDLNTDFYLNPDLWYAVTDSMIFVFSHDGQYLATTARNRERQEVVIAWDTATGEEILNVPLHQSMQVPSYGLAWLTDADQLAVAVNDSDAERSRILFFDVTSD